MQTERSDTQREKTQYRVCSKINERSATCNVLADEVREDEVGWYLYLRGDLVAVVWKSAAILLQGGQPVKVAA